MISIEFDYLPPPPGGDPLESKTWARLGLKIGELELTRVWDRAAGSMRESIFVPLFPLAEWIVHNWWALLYEPCPVEFIPEPGAPTSVDLRDWIRRHSLRASLPGYASPFACLYSQGKTCAVVSRPDPHRRYAHTPVEFTESERGEAKIEREELAAGLARIVEGVLGRIRSHDDERVQALQRAWDCLVSPPPQEAEFCRAAGRLGLDPYDTDDWPPGVVDWFEGAAPGSLDCAFTSDLLELPAPPSVKRSQHQALVQIVQSFNLGPGPAGAQPAPAAQTAHEEGYSLARSLRHKLGLSDEDPIEPDLAARAALGQSLRHEVIPMPDGGVLSVVGWTREPVMTSRGSGPRETWRFLAARALYLALRGTQGGPRLLTDARTWDQRASRAFGAELLAPQTGVARRLEREATRVGEDEAEAAVSAHYMVGATLVQRQRENWGRAPQTR